MDASHVTIINTFHNLLHWAERNGLLLVIDHTQFIARSKQTQQVVASDADVFSFARKIRSFRRRRTQ